MAELIKGVERDNIHMIRRLLLAKCDPNYNKGEDGLPPLFLCKSGEVRILNLHVCRN